MIAIEGAKWLPEKICQTHKDSNLVRVFSLFRQFTSPTDPLKFSQSYVTTIRKSLPGKCEGCRKDSRCYPKIALVTSFALPWKALYDRTNGCHALVITILHALTVNPRRKCILCTCTCIISYCWLSIFCQSRDSNHCIDKCDKKTFWN